jgi:predicted anti-sigma-YlaC factor YlaD
MKLSLDCKAMSRLISAAQDGRVPLTETARMQLHFAVCEACRNVDEQMAFLRRAMRGFERPEALDAAAQAIDRPTAPEG